MRASVGEPFGVPINMGSTVNSKAGDGAPVISADGLTLLFHSDRAGGQGKHDLWICTRPASKSSAGPATSPMPVAEKESPPRPTAPVAASDASQDPALKKRTDRWRKIESGYEQGMAPIERMLVAWNFARAAKALEELKFDEPDLAARLAVRREEVKRLIAIKSRIVERLNTAEPRLKKTALALRGMNGEVTKADDKGIATTLPTGKVEIFAWGELSEKTRDRLLQRAIDTAKADDCLAAGLLASACRDEAATERFFAKAAELGAKIEPHLTPLAAAAFARAEELIEKQQFQEAAVLLSSIQEKYVKTPWLASNKEVIEAACAKAARGITEAEAERLFAEAAELFAEKEFFDLEPLVKKLKAVYATTRPVTDPQRKPPFADLEKAVAGLGRRVTVRLDGKGDFKSIQAAVDAAAANTLLEIEDNGPYRETVRIAKEGLTIRGKRGFWPIITSVGIANPVRTLLEAAGRRTTLERLVLAHGLPFDSDARSIHVLGGPLSIRSCILWGGWPFYNRTGADCELRSSFLVGSPWFSGRITVTDCIWLGTPGYTYNESRFHNTLFTSGLTLGGCHFFGCTIAGPLKFAVGEPERGGEGKAIDCIVSSIEAGDPRTQIEHCDVYGSPPLVDKAKSGKGVFTANPRFADPKNLDYRLLPTSPCIGKASDGGNIGCRYTPQMIQVLKMAFELRSRGIIKF
jgi:hypothetical protein